MSVPAVGIRPETRVVVVAVTPHLLAGLLLFRCPLAPVGGDWHIAARSRDETERVLGFLKLNRAHAIVQAARRSLAPVAAAVSGKRVRGHKADAPGIKRIRLARRLGQSVRFVRGKSSGRSIVFNSTPSTASEGADSIPAGEHLGAGARSRRRHMARSAQKPPA